jgi:nitroreductase
MVERSVSPQSFEEVVLQRRSIRRYQQRDVPEAVIAEILETTRQAPSSMNGQPWCFVIVRDAETKRRISELKNRFCPPEKRSFSADFLSQAPVIMVVGVERSRSFGRELENGVLATAWLLLAAQRQGLGSVYLSAYQPHDRGLEVELGELVHLPEDIQPVTLLPLGYPAETPATKELRPLSEMLHHEFFGA